eukprot:scaffold220524_cov13-Tisochrysis_lutea.AAC.1
MCPGRSHFSPCFPSAAMTLEHKGSMRGAINQAGSLWNYGSSGSTLPQKQATRAYTKQVKRTETPSDSLSNEPSSGMHGPGVPAKIPSDTQSDSQVVAGQEQEDAFEASDPLTKFGANPHELVQKEVGLNA